MSKSLSIDNDIEYLTCTSNYMSGISKAIPIPINSPKSPQCSLSQENFDNLYFLSKYNKKS
jgi:hypothetical protein